MNSNSIQMTLKLSPLIQTMTSPVSTSDDWLDNNDINIFSATDNPDATATINQVLENITVNNAARVFRLSTLEIQQTAAGFILLQQAEAILLSDGDVIAINDHYLQVQVLKQAIVQNPQPSTPLETAQQHIDDIWQLDLSPEQDAPLCCNLDTYSDSLASHDATHNQDPLNFLNGNSPATYTPQESYPDAADQKHYCPENAGNVLRELGINESSLSLRDSTAHQQVPLSQQAPLDMIDEFLNDDHDTTATAPDYHSTDQQTYYHCHKAATTSSWQNFKKKLLA